MDKLTALLFITKNSILLAQDFYFIFILS